MAQKQAHILTESEYDNANRKVIKVAKVSTKRQVTKTVPASYTLPLQSVPGPLSFSHSRKNVIKVVTKPIVPKKKKLRGLFVVEYATCWFGSSSTSPRPQLETQA